MRAVKGEDNTVFGRISDGSHSYTKGVVVRVQNQLKKPATIGRILHFYIQKASQALNLKHGADTCCMSFIVLMLHIHLNNH